MKTMTAAALALLLMSGATHDVSQKGKTFSVSDLTVAVGDEVRFHNDDDVTHNVFSMTQGHTFNLAVQEPGTNSTVKFDAAGDIEVRCAFHPDMKMVVHVQP